MGVFIFEPKSPSSSFQVKLARRELRGAGEAPGRAIQRSESSAAASDQRFFIFILKFLFQNFKIFIFFIFFFNSIFFYYCVYFLEPR